MPAPTIRDAHPSWRHALAATSRRVVRGLNAAIGFGSVLLCGGVVTLWVRAACTSDSIESLGKNAATGGFEIITFRSRGARIEFEYVAQNLVPHGQFPPPGAREVHHRAAARSANEPRWFSTEFRFRCRSEEATRAVIGFGRVREQEHALALRVPDWSLTLALAVPPTLWALPRVRRRGRLRRGFCPSCAYDVRASSDKCPECGTPVVRCEPGDSTQPPEDLEKAIVVTLQ